MIKDSITRQEVVEFLNEGLKIDQKAMTDIFRHFYQCNEAFSNHPTIQSGIVGEGSNFKTPGPQEYEVGAFGILNGLFGVYGETGMNNAGSLAYEFDEDTQLITKFMLNGPAK